MTRKRSKKNRGDRFGKSIYLLPNLVTVLNLFCGFYAVVSSINGRFVAAAFAIFIAGVFDNLDGKVARATQTTSRFGVELDSLADVISFGMAPGIMMYLWALAPLGRIGWLAAFLFVVCGALRLARFNTQTGTVSSDYFVGLPIPAAAGMNAATVLFCNKLHITDQVHPFIFLTMIYVLSFLMVSTVRYQSFKKPELFLNKNFNVLVTSILVLIFIAAQPSIALFFIGAAYVASGPFMSLHRRIRPRSTEAAQEEDQSSNPV